jgi:hypothetical protein
MMPWGTGELLVFNDLLSDVAAGALLGAAILCLTRGRYLGRADVASTGLALLVLATMRGVLGDLRSGSLTTHGIPFVNIVVISGGSALALAILFNASYGPAAARQIRRPSTWFISGIAAIGTVACLTAYLLRGSSLDEFGFIILAAVTTVGWLIVTYRHVRTSQPVNRWLPALLGLTTASSAARIPASLSPDTLWLVLPGLIAVVSAMIAIVGSMLDMRELVVDQREHLTRRGHDQERLHDVRSALAGLQLAATSLTSYEDRIDAPMRRRLHESVSAELIRLRELIEPTTPARTAAAAPVSLLAAIRPVLDADALRGTTLAVDIDDLYTPQWCRSSCACTPAGPRSGSRSATSAQASRPANGPPSSIAVDAVGPALSWRCPALASAFTWPANALGPWAATSRCTLPTAAEPRSS